MQPSQSSAAARRLASIQRAVGPAAPAPAAGTAGAFDMSALLAAASAAAGAAPGGMGTTAAVPAAAPVDPAVRFATQLSTLEGMGFTDKEANLRALQQANGNVNVAVERLLG